MSQQIVMRPTAKGFEKVPPYPLTVPDGEDAAAFAAAWAAPLGGDWQIDKKTDPADVVTPDQLAGDAAAQTAGE